MNKSLIPKRTPKPIWPINSVLYYKRMGALRPSIVIFTGFTPTSSAEIDWYTNFKQVFPSIDTTVRELTAFPHRFTVIQDVYFGSDTVMNLDGKVLEYGECYLDLWLLDEATQTESRHRISSSADSVSASALRNAFTELQAHAKLLRGQYAQ